MREACCGFGKAGGFKVLRLQHDARKGWIEFLMVGVT